MEKKGNKIEALQGLRMILFLTIFFFHVSIFSAIGNDSKLYNWVLRGGGTLAVAYFFVLSGFSICFRKRKERH